MPSSRIQIQDVQPQVDCGRYPCKAILGDRVGVAATIFRDGHETLRATVRYRPSGARRWRETPLEPVGNDRWEGGFTPDALGRFELRVQAWADPYATWLDEVARKLAAGRSDLAGELSEGEALFGPGTVEEWRERAEALSQADRRDATKSLVLRVDVERALARFGAWYELFPRSWGGFRGVAAVLPDLAELGFDVVYLPPVHPIGSTNRKGRNNTQQARKTDPGSPWAIGAAAGGHDALHPVLGTEADFDAMVEAAHEAGIELALDFAIQCSPDHPWLTGHPEWFQRRPDGSLKAAENPPKRYDDIHNVNWESADREGLWNALRDVALHWCERGIRVFRVDNPHTKPVPFWEWLIASVRAVYPDTVFLAEAFTRPAPMTTLAKVGFGQSYTYFTWKNTKAELIELVEQLRSWSAFYRPNMWPNTPDILHAYLQQGGRPAFEARLVLAATISPSYGIYSGYEACENVPVRQGSEEYLDSEKYEARRRRLEGPLLPLIRRLNAIRRAHPALQRFESLRWLETQNDDLIAYVKREAGDTVIVVVNLDPRAAKEGLCIVPGGLGLPETFTALDLLADTSFRWRTGRNYVRLPPGGAHVIAIGEAA
ncbi:MAG: maltotransferase domain-containing protein [Gaiellaceae bacterium]